MVNTAAAGVMFGFAVYVARDISLEGWAPGELPAAVAALTVMVMFLVGPRVKDWEAEAGQYPRGRHKKEPAHIIEGELLSVSPARHPPTRSLPSPPTLRVSDTANDVQPRAVAEVQKQSADELNDAAEQTAVATPGHSPSERAANGWKMASFILDPTDAAWSDMRGRVAQVARPSTRVMIEAVVSAARRLWHSGNVPHLKDTFIADVIAAPEVQALGPLKPRMDVVRKLLDGSHTTLLRAAKI